MKWLALSLGLMVVTTGSGCWRPYYGRNYAQPAVAQPVFTQPTYQQQPVMQTQPAVVAQPQMMQAAPQQCVPCQPVQHCVPCY